MGLFGQKLTQDELSSVPKIAELKILGFSYKISKPKLINNARKVSALYSVSFYEKGVGEYYIYLYLKKYSKNIEGFKEAVDAGTKETLNAYKKGNVETKKVDFGFKENVEIYYIYNKEYNEEGYYIGGMISSEKGISMSISYPKEKHSKDQVKKLFEIALKKS
jgi:hypothetical protein